MVYNTTMFPGYVGGTDTCASGVTDCIFLEGNMSEVCTDNNDAWSRPEKMLWNVIVTGFLACIMCFGIGANDAANAWATAVGSGALPLRFAVVIGGIMEWIGAMALGYGVAKTVTKGTAKVTDPDCFACGYCDSKMSLYAVGMLSALFSASVVLMLATFSSLPVSTTHAIIGGTVGATVTSAGFGCLEWKFDGGLGGIIASWFISPIVSGIMGVIVFVVTKYTMIFPFWKSGKPTTPIFMGLTPALIGQPICAGLHSFIIIFVTMLKTPQTKKLDIGLQVLYAGVPALSIFTIFLIFTILYQRHHLPSVWAEERRMKLANGATESQLKALALRRGEFIKPSNPILAFFWNNKPFFKIPSLRSCFKKGIDDDDDSIEMITVAVAAEEQSANEPDEKEKKEQTKEELYIKKKADDLDNAPIHIQDAHYCFRALLIYNAVWDSFAHGANDTGNATGAFAGAYNVYVSGTDMCSKGETPVYVMAIAGLIMFFGITTMGQFVIKTIGSKLAFIDYHIGFCVEMASTVAVIIATFLELPISTTHCQVGAIIAIGTVADWRAVSWRWIGAVSLGWILTLPLAALFSAALTAIFREAIRN